MYRGVGGAALPLEQACDRPNRRRDSLRKALDDAGFSAMQSSAQERFDHRRHCREAFVFCEPLMIAIVDLLDDYRNLKAREHYIKIHVRNIASGLFCITLDELCARHAARMRRWTPSNFL